MEPNDLTARGLRVRALEFSEGMHHGAKGRTLIAHGIFGEVSVTTGWDNGKAAAFRFREETRWFGDEDAAIVFLQADYETRILAAIEVMK